MKALGQLGGIIFKKNLIEIGELVRAQKNRGEISSEPVRLTSIKKARSVWIGEQHERAPGRAYIAGL